jgi:aminopeptidase N
VLNSIARADQKAMRTLPKIGPSGNLSDYDVTYHRFNYYVDPAIVFLRGSVATHFRVLESDFQQLSFDMSHALSVDSIVYHGHEVNYQHTVDNLLTVLLGEILPVGQLDSVTVYYHGIPQPGEGFGSFMQAYHAGEPVIWTLSEPYGSSDWWPCKDGLNDKIDSIDMIITTPARYRAAGNGLLVEEKEVGPDKIYHWKHRYSIVPYLIAFAVTNYTFYSDWCVTGADSVEVLNYVYPENIENARKGTGDLIGVMQYFTQRFGPYPFREEKYGHAQFSQGGGMEHQTMSFMGGFGFELSSHELAHSWFGNMITCGSWHEIWLNEGFATYCAGLAYEHFFPDLYWPVWKNNNISYITQAPDGAVYVTDTTSVARIFSARLSYSKAAFLLHMLRWIMGDEVFFRAINEYLTDPSLAYGFASTADLKRHLEEACQLDLTGFFNDWYTGEGYPSYSLLCYPLPDTQYQLIIHQKQSHPSVDFFEMPLPVRFKNATRDTLMVLDHRYSGEAFVVDPGFVADSILFDPDRWIVSRGNSVIINPPDDSRDAIQMLPNPTDELLQVVTQTLEMESVMLFDLCGRQVQVPVVTLVPRRSLSLDLSACPPGIYLLKISTSTGVKSGKVVKAD